MAEFNPMEDTRIFIANLAKALAAARIDWAGLSKLTGIAEPDLYRMKRCDTDRGITLKRAARIANCLGYATWELLKPNFRPKKQPYPEESTVAS